MALGFKGRCARGHDEMTFTDRGLFEAHMTGPTHRVKRLHPGGPVKPDNQWGNRGGAAVSAPGWAGGKISPPRKWQAPKPTAASAKALEQWVKAGDLTIESIA